MNTAIKIEGRQHGKATCCTRFIGMSGIYWIRNTVNGKLYIGSSSEIRTRLTNHIGQLHNGIHYNEHLQRAWNTYGAGAFVAEVLEIVAPEDLETVEQWYLDNTRCLDPRYGYNIKPTANNAVMSESTKRKIGDANRGKPKPPMSDSHREKLIAHGFQKGRTPWNVGMETSAVHRIAIGEGIKSAHRRSIAYKSEEYRNRISERMKKLWKERGASWRKPRR